MYKYILKRLFLLIPTLMVIVLLSFMMVQFSGADPAKIQLELSGDVVRFVAMANASELIEQRYQEIRAEMGLDDPFIIQLFRYYQRLFQPNLGIPSHFWSAFRVSFIIAFISFFIATAIGIPLGVIGASKKHGVFDRVSLISALALSAIPGFIMAVIIRQIYINLLRIFSFLPPSAIAGSMDGTILRWILPIISLSAGGVAYMLLLTRSDMANALNQDYIRTAHSKGAPYKQIVWKHAFRNVAMTVTTIAGNNLIGFLVGVIFIEEVFRIPGIMSMILFASITRNIDTMQSCLIIIGMSIAVINLIVDVSYAFADPRIRSQYN